jgi:aminomethyltransferase
MRKTVLHARHLAAGAKCIDFGGWDMPLQYGPILEEVSRVRESVGLFDLGHMGRVSVVGPERVELVDRVATNRVAKVPEGAIRYGLLCREDGNPIDDVLVYRGPDEVFVVVNASNRERDLAWMREHGAGFDAEVRDLTDEQAMLALQGQKSEATLQKLTDVELSELGYYRFTHGAVNGVADVRISRTGYTGEDGFELYLPQDRAEALWDALLEAGAEFGIGPIGLGARDTLRLEAGMPLYGHEISDELNPVEAGLIFGVSLHKSKAGTIGYDALARIKADPQRRLVGLTTPGPRVPRQGHPLLHGDRQVGFVCSGSVSPTLDAKIASAYVELGLDVPGQTLEVDFGSRRQTALVQELPFFSRTRD